MSGNFKFFENDFPELEKYGSLAEKLLYVDPNSCIFKLGLMSETQVNLMFDFNNIIVPDDESSVNKINTLKQEGILPNKIFEMFHQLRTNRNKAAHEGFGELEIASILLEMAWRVSVWFMQTYGDDNFEPNEFVLPLDQSKNINYEELVKENEEPVKKLKAVTKPVSNLTPTERRERSEIAASKIKLSENATRFLKFMEGVGNVLGVVIDVIGIIGTERQKKNALDYDMADIKKMEALSEAFRKQSLGLGDALVDPHFIVADELLENLAI